MAGPALLDVPITGLGVRPVTVGVFSAGWLGWLSPDGLGSVPLLDVSVTVVAGPVAAVPRAVTVLANGPKLPFGVTLTVNCTVRDSPGCSVMPPASRFWLLLPLKLAFAPVPLTLLTVKVAGASKVLVRLSVA